MIAHVSRAMCAALFLTLASAGAQADPKSESWGDRMRAHMKTYEKDKVAAAAAAKACDKLKPSARMDDARCVALERRKAIDVVRSKGPKGVF